MRVSARPGCGVGPRSGVLWALLCLSCCDASTPQPPPSRSAKPRQDDPQPVTAPAEVRLVEPPGCPGFKGPERLGTAPRVGLAEASGLAASLSHPGHWWTHNDSGSGAVMHLLGPDGDRRMRVALRDARALDWEDMAAVVDPSGHPWVYVADFGDNFRIRPKVQIYRFEEPTQVDARRKLVDAARVDLSYPDAPHNAEALLVDPRSLEVLIVTKEEDGRSRLFRARDPFASAGPDAETIVLEDVGVSDYGAALVRGANLVTAGDVRSDGAAILLRTYTGACWYWRGEDQALHEAIAGDCCPMPLAPEPQGESIAFTRGADGYATISEGNGSPIWGFAPPSQTHE